MDLYSNDLYSNDIQYVAKLDLPWGDLRNKNVLISGATGLIGSFLIDVIMEKNNKDNLNCTVYALGRNEKKAKNRFKKNYDSDKFVFISYDIQREFIRDDIGKVGYILHLASNTHPVQYAKDPVGTITTNIIGAKNMLDFAMRHKAKRFVFASSNEVYGENRGDVEFFDEKYCGYIDSNTMRAGYPESKRCGEALCQAYKSQYGMDVVVPRFTRTYGPTMLMSDTKAVSQFIKKGIEREDIVLKSAGTQFYSYQYVVDSVSGLLYVMLCGDNGEAYNIADEESDITLKDLAQMIAKFSGTNISFEIPDSVEASGYSVATKARLAGNKLRSLGWKPRYNIETGIKRTIEILKD